MPGHSFSIESEPVLVYESRWSKIMINGGNIEDIYLPEMNAAVVVVVVAIAAAAAAAPDDADVNIAAWCI